LWSTRVAWSPDGGLSGQPPVNRAPRARARLAPPSPCGSVVSLPRQVFDGRGLKDLGCGVIVVELQGDLRPRRYPDSNRLPPGCDSARLPRDLFSRGPAGIDTRITFMTGTTNHCFSPLSQQRSYEWFSQYHVHDRHALEPLPGSATSTSGFGRTRARCSTWSSRASLTEPRRRGRGLSSDTPPPRPRAKLPSQSATRS
jgi:hypothetical protein